MSVKFTPPTPAERLEEASFRAKEATIVYQDAAGRTYEAWADYMWAELRRNANGTPAKKAS